MIDADNPVAPTPPALPRSLRSPDERSRRRQMLGLPHIAPLTAYAAHLRAQDRGSVPDFDPLDGGIFARALFLLEKPGPMTDAEARGARVGSGFISRDNDDPTAEAIFRFMEAAAIPRCGTILWNLVPWWNGSRALTPAELRDGAAALANLISLLPNIRAVVLVGRRAASAFSRIARADLPVFVSAHPSPIVRATRLHLWEAIPDDAPARYVVMIDCHGLQS